MWAQIVGNLLLSSITTTAEIRFICILQMFKSSLQTGSVVHKERWTSVENCLLWTVSGIISGIHLYVDTGTVAHIVPPDWHRRSESIILEIEIIILEDLLDFFKQFHIKSKFPDLKKKNKSLPHWACMHMVYWTTWVRHNGHFQWVLEFWIA